MKLRLLLYIALICTCTCSCKTTSYTRTLRNITIFQTLENGRYGSSGLAKDKDWNVFYVISVRTHIYDNEMYYDGKNISGYYYIVGTYAYETKSGAIKTVRALVRRENYNSMDPQERMHFKSLLRNILTYYYEFHEEEKQNI